MANLRRLGKGAAAMLKREFASEAALRCRG
jgi:hypothetical protein